MKDRDARILPRSGTCSICLPNTTVLQRVREDEASVTLCGYGESAGYHFCVRKIRARRLLAWALVFEDIKGASTDSAVPG